MSKQIARHGTSLAIQYKEVVGKIKSMDLSKTAFLKSGIQTIISKVKNINQDQRRHMESVNKEVESIRTGILNMPSL